MINVLCFAHLKDQIGQEKLTIENRYETVGELLEELSAVYSIETDSIIVAVNEEYAEREDKILSGDTVALIPPVSGG